MPEFESDKFLTSAQLRLSLAAKTKNYSADQVQRFVVEYSYGTDDVWEVATIIDIEDEISTSINGGYFLVSLEKPSNQSQLSNLQVRVSYQGNIKNLDRAFVEGLWLEVTSASFYEEADPEFIEGGLDYLRSLEAPKFHELNESELDVVTNKLPSFTLSYEPQNNFLKRALNAVFSENEYQVDSVRVTSASGAEMNIPVKVNYQDDKTWTLEFQKQPQKLVPGKYTLELVVNENDTLYTDSFEFYWGVLAVNTTKSMYFPGEDITLNLAALTDRGDTICDARLELQIIDPENNITEVPVSQSGFCGKNNVTDVPDYLAEFNDTNLTGRYTIQLVHLNRDGDIVHRIQDSFEVREYIPYDIERTAPTRIYPPSPYSVTLNIKANRTFSGDIIERVPKGFAIENTNGAEIRSLPDYTEIVWLDVSLEEGDEIGLGYTFDAPDISPYLYLLGPLNMDGFEELRQWQIASDALGAVAHLTGTGLVGGSELNLAAPDAIVWSTSTIDAYYFEHSTSTESQKLIFKQAGDYSISLNVPINRISTDSNRARWGTEIRLNGVALDTGLGRTGYIRGVSGTNHTESSNHTNILLTDISVDDYIEVYSELLSTYDAGISAEIDGQASLLVEFISPSETIFSAKTTFAIASTSATTTDLNQAFPNTLSWIETRQDTGFVHSDAINPQEIIISDPGTYLVQINIPLTSGDIAQRPNVLGRVRLDGAEVPGGQFKQGYLRGSTQTGDGDSSLHWSGIVVSTTTNQILTVTGEQESVAGIVDITSGFAGSIFMQKLPATDVISLRGTQLAGPTTNWNPGSATAVLWETRNQYDAGVFTHSTTTNSHEITVNSAGDYYLVFNDAVNTPGGANRQAPRATVYVDGSPVIGATTRTNYMRDGTHNNASAALTILLPGLASSSVITLVMEQEANSGTVDDTTDSILMIWKKAELNLRAEATASYDTPFDNIRFASTTPYFRFGATDPDGSSDIAYEFSISTSSDFSASTTRVSGTDSGFSNTASSTDTSPFIEGDIINFQLQPGDTLTDLTTYYWRVRAIDSGGSGLPGDWTTTQSLTVDLAAQAPSWFQSYSGQFENNTLVGAVSNGVDRVEVDATLSSEMILAYGEGTETAPRYRFWEGSAWGVEGNALSVSNTINWVRTAAGTTRDEYILMTLDQSNDTYAQVYSASTSSWSDLSLISPNATSSDLRGIAVAYESISGDAMAISCDSGANPVYRIWNGSSWSATSSITVSSLNDCNFLELASDPASDELILVVRDTGAQYEALVWDGSAWIESKVIGSSSKVNREGISVIYESSGDQAIIVVSDFNFNRILYTTWNGVEFSLEATQNLGADFEFGRMTADPDSDNVVLCYIDDANDIGVLRWDGGVWDTFTEIEVTGNDDRARPVECQYETLPGRDGYIMASYSDNVGVRYQTATSSAWSAENNLSTINDSFWVQSKRLGDGTIVTVALDDVADNIESSYWNGSNWSSNQTLESSPSSVIGLPYEMYDMSPKRFQFTEGVVESAPIDFGFVPGQPTWGDISFDSLEPFGTDVRLRLKYSNVGICDAYISDGVLSGNGAGFNVTDSPIDITSLSTTTYDQICLEATLTTLGNASASLTEWELSWVRQPKLVQNNYRWYVNGSFLTPTDPWPVGVFDLSENESVSSDLAINNGDTIRLRMSLQGQNVPLPQFAEAFKIQYAEGFNCSSVTDWADVGDSASTTALWRGYENSIVGSDWLDADWGRRIKITVDNNVVEEGVTDFPVYLDLANLPAGFFNNVQSDGDDIRITSDDGISELPFELVAIDTAIETGELHFKADLASTTDSEFFVYYSNAGASGYAVGATYGSRNVWTNNYNLRYALDDSPVAASPQFKDSTSNNNNAVARAGMTVGDVITGQIGDAIDLDGNDGGLFQSPITYSGEYTLSTWWYSTGNGFAFSKETGADEKIGPWTGGGSNMFFRVLSGGSSDQAVPRPSNSTWHHVAITRDSSNKIDFYVDGAAPTRLFSNAAQSGSSLWENFGGQTSQGFNGRMDELRMADTKRSSGWITTEFNNQSNPTGFYDISAEELISDGRLLPSTLLTASDVAETYEEENPTRENQNLLPVGDDAEWDFVLQNNNAAVNTNYCFRMVYEDGSVFNSYTNYPRLITNAPPLAPELSAPFDNEQLASTTPWFDFTTDDELGDDVAYQIQVSTDVAFGSTLIDRNSISNFAEFTNLSQPAQKSTFTTGEIIRFESGTTLSNATTYWWRVRAQDPSGSGSYGEWSSPDSFTVNTGTLITTWFQTTGDQFATNNLLETVFSVSTNDIGIETGFTAGTTTSTVIDYDDRDTGNAWGDFTFTNNVSSGNIRYYIEYRVSGENFDLIPDADLSGNSSGFTSTVSLVGLDPVIYNEIRIVAAFSGNSTLPRLQDWRVTWSETIDVPTLTTPFDNAKVSTTTPSFTFFTSDPEDEDLQYELQLSSSYDFAASSTFTSGVDAGFLNTEDGGDTSPFNTDDVIRYTAQSPLTNGNTYWWRVRARDPGGSNSWSNYSVPESFTVDTAITTSVWFQTTGDQFATGNLTDIETIAGGAQITSTIREVMSVYGEGSGQAPQYVTWNGTEWSTPASAASVGAQISWLELKASPARPEYALGTLGTDFDVNFQIYNSDTDTWGDLFEMQTESTSTKQRTFNLAYESLSGDLLALSCNGTDAIYSIWNGTSWSATSSIALTNTNDCLYIQVASDPVSDEIIAVFGHEIAGVDDFEAMVWNGSSWGSADQFGGRDTAANEGMAVGYEESGGQAIVAVSNSDGNATTLLYNIWNGTSWSGTSTHALGDRIEWATLKSDQGTDRMALCYIDNDTDIGVLFWDGSAWETFTELEVTGNDARGRAVDCEFETEGLRDGYLMVAYSDTGSTRYQEYDGISFSGELNIPSVTDTFEDTLVRAGDGLIHLAAYDDAPNPDRIEHRRFDGTAWTTDIDRFTTNSSLNNSLPYVGGISMAPQVYPNFTNGSIRSTDINFSDGTGPRWEEVTWNDTTPGSSLVEYRVYFESAPGVFSLIPDLEIAGNAAGLTSSPIDISSVDRTIYSVLQLDAQLVCDSGDCPTIQDWSVSWSEGITVSGIAREYDGMATTTSGTVAVSVNGALQPGKTGTILGDGTWSIANVTAFPGDTVLVFVDGAADADESLAAATYNGVGNITGMELNKRHLTIGANEIATTTNSGLNGYDNSDDEDIFMTVDASSNLNVCVEITCGDAKLKIKSGTAYAPGAAVITHDFENFGTFAPATNTIRVSGSWNGQGNYIEDTSTVIFTATSTSETINATGTIYSFYNVTFGETSGTATWTLAKPLDVNGSLSISQGTLARGTSTFTIAGNLSVGTNGFVTGIATTTFDGTGSNTWGDSKTSTTSSNMGHVVVDGTTKTVTLAGNVGAQSVTIGADDTLNASGSGFNINVVRNWTNNNVFIPQTGTVTFVGTTTETIRRGSSAFNNLSFTGVGGSWSFASSTLALNGNLSIATGTVTLPTGTTTIGGSFLNTGGTFAHNNGEVRMTSNSGGRTITQSGTTFLNAFYDLVFSGSGAWSYTEANATTSRNFRIQSGTVTMPTGQATIGGDFLVTGTGAFAHNNGEVILLVQDSDPVQTNGSSFNNLRTVGATSGSWYNDNWTNRLAVTIQASQVDATLTDFPVYVNLDDLNDTFFSLVRTNGGDIRVTAGDGVTELPRELVSINTGTRVGELYFLANSLSSTTDTTFYIYYGNAAASNPAVSDTYGARNVWSNGYVIVAHMGDLTTSTVLNSAGSTNGIKTNTAGNPVVNNPLGVTTGYLYDAQDFSTTPIQHTGNFINGVSQYNVSMWFNPDDVNGTGPLQTNQYGNTLYGSSLSGNYDWVSVGGTTAGSSANGPEVCVRAFTTSVTCNVTSGANITNGNWYYISINAVQNSTLTARVNGVTRGTFTSGNSAPGGNFTIAGLRPNRTPPISFDGRLDEVRVSTTTRTDAWRDAEYRNMATSSTFYTSGGQEGKRARTFTDTNVTILGSFNLDVGGDAVFPTGVLSIGGSFDNNAEFTSSNGTVRFNSTGGVETVAAGSSTFATLEFNSATGDFTVTENATATVAINLTSAQQFTLQSGRTLTALGTFSNAAIGANTTWTGSTLRLLSATTTNMNAKAHGGDVYGTLEAASSTLAKMWNSSAVSYLTNGTTSAIYSQDHAAVDGDLNIYGNYRRTTGTEYWSYATDFDGAALIASTSRQVDVRIATSSTVGLTNASFNISGIAAASTTIDAISGAFGLNATNTTVTAEYFTLSGVNTNGLNLRSSSTLSVFKDGLINVVPGRSGITIDAATVDTNPASQFFRIGFATTSVGAASNVTLSGSPSSFIWFRDGSGDLYGENFDNGDGNPGSIRFDDSSNSIIVSGTVYSDDGVTAMGGPTCDGSTQNVRIVVNSGSYASSTSCSGINGSYSFPVVNYIGDPKIVVYLDTNGGAKGSVVTKTPTTNITNMHIYQNRVITRHQDVLPLTASDMQLFDNSDDSDISFVAATTSLTLLPNTELYVFASTTFAPGGNITLTGNGNANSYEGTLQLGSGATFTATGTETHTLAGRFVMATTSTFNAASSTFVFNATTTGKSITSPNTVTFNQIQFNGVGGGWNITAPLSVQADMLIAAGTVTGTSNITLTTGSLYGNGVLSLGSGTTTINRTNTLGGTSAWTFNNLILGNGTVVGTTTPNTSATTTILGRLTIANAHFLDAGNTIWDLAGIGTVFTETGTLLEDTSRFIFSGNNANVPSTTFYDLYLNAAAGSSVFTAVGSGINILNNLSVGGSASTTVNFNTNDPVIAVGNDLTINTGATLVASDSGLFTISGDYDNNGSFVSSNGSLTFNGVGTQTIAAGNSAFGSVIISGTGAFSVTENATSTASWNLINHSNFTVDPGVTLAIGGTFTNGLGGAATTWTGSTLRLFGGGTRNLNASTTIDSYANLEAATSTYVRIWNSDAGAYLTGATSGIYSQDHANTNGDLYIFGNFTSNSTNDHWSYGTDFDGTALGGGNERQVNVRLASGGSASWTGGSLSVLGTTTASTTIANQGVGTYGINLGGNATVDWDRVNIRDINSSGVVFGGAPTVTNFSRTNHLVQIDSASAITVGGTVINTNEAKSFTDNIFAADIGVTGAVNVTATGTAVSSWRFTNHLGDIAGEGFDNDPAGDPGYITWDDSAALITVSGVVYSDEGSTLSTICDGSTSNIRLVVANASTDTTYNTTCSAATSSFSISNVAYSPLDTLVLYIVGETEKAANVTIAPISSIGNMHLYENRVIVRHENTNPITIADMSVWDSSDDADIPYTAIDSGTDTLTLPANRKLLIWTGKTFEPNGNVTLAGGGAGAAFDGTLEAQTNSIFRAKGTETHSVGGSFIFGTNAIFTAASSTITMTTTGAARTFDVNENRVHSLNFTGSGSMTMTDPTLNLSGTYSQNAGNVTFVTGTTTVGTAFNATGGSFSSNGPLVFTATSTSNIVRFNNSTVGSLFFTGPGSWNMTDTNATTTGRVLISSGTVTLPSGNLAVTRSFEKTGGSIVHNTSDLIMLATSTANLTASSSSLYAVRFVGPANFTITDTNITFLDSFEIASGTVTMASGTTAVGGSLTATGGLFTAATGTVLLNSATGGRTINSGSSSFNNLQIGAPSGGYTLFSATTTKNFIIANANILTVNPGATITVGGVFTNSVGGAATTWTGTTLRLVGGVGYSVNTKLNSGDVYGTLVIDNNTDVRSWFSSAATTTVSTSSSLYSQDHAVSDGQLYIYGDLTLATSSEYWNYANDFDGAVLTGGSRRQARVYFAQNATTTLESGSLQMIGETGNETLLQNQSTGTYAFRVTGGTFSANYYEISDININGIQLEGQPTISDLSNGYYDLAVNTGSLITLSSTTLNANPSKIFDNVGFHATTGLSGFNVNLVGETTNAWRFTNSYGNIGGEGFDIDGLDACGFIRFDNSSCLLTEQTHTRWRFDDGLEGAPNSEWYESSFDYRKRVRVLNNDNQTYTTTAVKVIVPYESSMQSDFEDLRFTDSTGLAEVPFWLEKFTASTEAQVWVQLPSLPASSYANVYMYYGSSTAVSFSNGSTTFNAFDDYEDNNITEYSGDTGLFSVVTSPVFGGTYALKPSNTSGKTTNGIFRFDDPVSQGQIIRYMQYVNTAGTTDEPCTLFGVQSPGTTNQNYGVCLELFGVDRMSISKNVKNNDSSGTLLASTTVSYTTGWYEVEIDWQTNNSIKASLYNSAGSLVATASTTDSSYTSGGFGYAFWFNNGAWDSFTSRPRVATKPTVYLGAEQTDGGASWSSALDASGSALPGDVARLRISIENSGLDITAQQYRLEFAAKGVAPTCESVSGGAYAVVPNQAACGSSPVCMQTSAFVSNGAVTTDLLFGTDGTFSSGLIVTDPSNQSSSVDIDQNYYTELEYVITPTVNASDAYCFRVTNAGTPLDFYAKVAELGLQFDPTFGAVDLNGGVDISLTPGTTTPVVVTGTVTDFNGFSDITHATATIYRSGAGSACTPDNNNCYVVSTESGQCSLNSCSGNSCTLSCQADIFFHADPTDAEAYEGEEWLAYAEASDFSGGYDFASAPGVELITLRALNVDSLIDYGAIEANSNTGSFNPATTITNLGNVPIDVDIEGNDLSDGSSSVITADNQKVATSTFTYSSCVTCQDLSTSTPVSLDINLTKPSIETPPVETDVYWGIAIPFSASNAAHFGTNIFTAIGVD